MLAAFHDGLKVIHPLIEDFLMFVAKYHELLPADSPTYQNGSSDGISSTTAIGGLVGDYNSDSDSDSVAPMDAKIKDFMNEIEHTEPEPVASTSQAVSDVKNGHYQVPGTSWLQCYDQSSGYPYYWNQLTNQVSWQPPPEFVAALQIMQKQQTVAAAAAAAASQSNITSANKPSKVKKPNNSVIKTKKKYPWEGSSDSEDEKIEMITSFGPQSGDESDGDGKRQTSKKKTRARSKKGELDTGAVVGPQLPPGVEESPDVYETSSLMTPLVADVGPPGVEVPREVMLPTPPTTIPDSSADEDPVIEINGAAESENSSSNDEDVLSKLKSKAKLLQNMGGEVPSPVRELLLTEGGPEGSLSNDVDNHSMEVELIEEKNDIDLADEILAEIEKEIPPDFVEQEPSRLSTEKPPTSFSLIASYGDDSDGEDVGDSHQIQPKNQTLFPSVTLQPAASKALFPAAVIVDTAEAKPALPVSSKNTELRSELSSAAVSPPPSAILDPNLPDSTTTHKAFKRKKRIELAVSRPEPEPVVAPVPSTSRADPYALLMSGPSTSTTDSLDDVRTAPVTGANPRYNMDPTSGEHRGFGFSHLEKPLPVEKKSMGIQFVKAETITFQPAAEVGSLTPRSKCCLAIFDFKVIELIKIIYFSLQRSSLQTFVSFFEPQ